MERRRDQVREYLVWAKANDGEDWTFRMAARPDIEHAAEAADAFAEWWWGVVVFTCFGSKRGAATVATQFARPLPAPEAEVVLERIVFPRGAIGHHRIQPALKGAKQALVAACVDHELLYDLLHSRDDFDTRYVRLRAVAAPTVGPHDLVRSPAPAGALALDGTRYRPVYAYLGGSTGPQGGLRSGLRPAAQDRCGRRLGGIAALPLDRRLAGSG